MKRRSILWIAPAFALALFSCGGGENSAGDKPGPAPKRSRLVALDAQGLDSGLELPDFTRYWTDAEAGNGNVYPVKSDVDDEIAVTARLDQSGELGLLGSGEFRPASQPDIAAAMKHLSREHWIEQTQVSPAALLLFADRRAPYDQLLELCKELAAQQVSNLWIVTRDSRDDALRLLPLYLDNTQVFREWYGLDETERARTARLRWVRSSGDDIAGTRRLVHLGTGRESSTEASTEWGARLIESFDGDGVTRLQFHLYRDARMEDFSVSVNELSALGVKQLEPFWPPLDEPEESDPVKERRVLDPFKDTLGTADDLKIPTLSTFWRASTTDNGLPSTAVLDAELPLLAIRVADDGGYATRTRDGEWQTHGDDLEVLEAMRANAGEIDFDTGLSDLQILLAIDREADWSHFMRVREMMHQSGCFRLTVVTTDPIGPTLRLLRLDLPLSSGIEGRRIAAVDVKRTGRPEDGDYEVEFTVDGTTHKVKGSNFTSNLMLLAEDREASPKVLAVRLPMDEPLSTYFRILNALAGLGMGELRFGG